MLPITQAPPDSCIHPVFCVSLLKKKLGETIAASIDLLLMVDDGDLLMEHEVLLDTC